MRCEGRDPFVLPTRKKRRTYGIDFIASCNSVSAIVIPFKYGGGGVGLKIEEGKNWLTKEVCGLNPSPNSIRSSQVSSVSRVE
jgi:hypothetical protein